MFGAGLRVRNRSTAALTFDSVSLDVDWRPTDSLRVEFDGHLNAVGNLDEGNAAVHPVLLAVEGHRSRNRACSSAPSGNRQRQLLGFRHSAYRKVPSTSKGTSPVAVTGPVCTIFVDLNVINGECSTSKKSLPFSLPFFMPLPVSTVAA